MAAGSNQYVWETHKSCWPVAERLINSGTAFICVSMWQRKGSDSMFKDFPLALLRDKWFHKQFQQTPTSPWAAVCGSSEGEKLSFLFTCEHLIHANSFQLLCNVPNVPLEQVLLLCYCYCVILYSCLHYLSLLLLWSKWLEKSCVGHSSKFLTLGFLEDVSRLFWLFTSLSTTFTFHITVNGILVLAGLVQKVIKKINIK